MPHASKVALYALLCFIWGSTWLVIKVGYGGLGPFNVAALRFFIAGLLCAPIVPLVGRVLAARPERVAAGHVRRHRAFRRSITA